jgi:hypothetical protein
MDQGNDTNVPDFDRMPLSEFARMCPIVSHAVE